MLRLAIGRSVQLLATLGVDLSAVAAVNFVFSETASESFSDSGGTPVLQLNLAGGSVQTRAATITNAAGGQVQYVLTPSDLSAPGWYVGQFQFTDASGALQTFPQTGGIRWEVYAPKPAGPSPGSFQSVGDFVEPVRAIMGDFKPPFQWEDCAIASVVRTVVRMGQLPGFGITADGQSLTSAVIRPRDLALLSYHSARVLLRPEVRSFGWRTRAASVRKGDQRDFLFELQNAIYYLENPEMMASFQTYYAWVNALAGINVWGLMSQMNVESPVATVTIGTGGIQINTT
ncbi:MAG: hypothetical protein ABSE16_01560 [Verrucomicrobiota bacterium]|jgi:hypothetical protein